MNQLPPSAAKLLEQARQHDRGQRLDVEAGLASLHAALPFADPGPALSLGDTEGGSASLQPDVSVVASGAGSTGTALFSGKLVKIFLAAITLGGAVGGASLWSAPGPSARVATQASAERAASAVTTASSVAEQPQLAAQPAAEATAQPQATTARVLLPRNERGELTRARGGNQTAKPSRRSAQAAEPTQTAEPTQVAGTTQAAASTQVAAAQAEPSAPRGEAQPAPEARATPSELDLIDAALRELHADRQARALALLTEHAQRYPDGKFSTERQGLRVLALCASGQLEQGRKERERFLRGQAKAPIAARVRGACASEPRE